jgi:hypothetical protein
MGRADGIDGVPVSARDTSLLLFEQQSELVLVLSSLQQGKYEVASGVGKFEVTDGRISQKARARLKDDRLVGMTVSQFEAEVRRLRP